MTFFKESSKNYRRKTVIKYKRNVINYRQQEIGYILRFERMDRYIPRSWLSKFTDSLIYKYSVSLSLSIGLSLSIDRLVSLSRSYTVTRSPRPYNLCNIKLYMIYLYIQCCCILYLYMCAMCSYIQSVYTLTHQRAYSSLCTQYGTYETHTVPLTLLLGIFSYQNFVQ